KALRKIETSGSGASIEVQLAADGDIAYNAFKLANPARVVVDLNGIKDKLPKNVIDVGGDLVKKIRVAQFKSAPDPVTRVVFDLAQPADFHVVKVGDKLQVSFGETSVAAGFSRPEPAPAEALVHTEAPKPAPSVDAVPVVAENA